MAGSGKAIGPRKQEAQILAAAFIDAVPSPFLVLDQDLVIVSASGGFHRRFGTTRREVEHRRLGDVADGKWDVPALHRILQGTLANGESFSGFELDHDCEILGRRSLLLNGRRIDPLRLILLAIEDVSSRTEIETHRELLIAELQHRVKNMLALVQSLAEQTGRRSPSLDHFLGVFGARLRALGGIHDLLFRSHGLGADLRALIEMSLAPHQPLGPDALDISGPPVILSTRQGQTLGLALHELATNASKHGALSVPAGKVRVEWALAGDDRSEVRLRWQERGGPAPAPRPIEGFGRIVLERACSYELGGSARLRFEPAGVRYELTFPLR